MTRRAAVTFAVLFATAACGTAEIEGSIEAEGAVDTAAFARSTSTTSTSKKGAPALGWVLRFSSARTAGTQPDGESEFLLTARSVFISVKWTNLTGAHQQTIYLYAPGGFLWQVMDQAFATTTTASTGQVQAEKLADGGYQTWEELPVAGTNIDAYGLTGVWTAKVVLDNAASPITTATFTLQ